MKEGLKPKRTYLIALALLLVSSLTGGNANAATPINRATVRSLRNTVQLILRDRSPRPAKVKDAMTPGDAVTTARSSMVELQFNDRSLARIGELALFQFLPNTRTFRLNNGTALLLIPPGQGTTRIQTPNAAAGIRGSALFVRYIPETATTIVGALTNSGIEIFNSDQSQRQPIAAGQMAVIVKDKIERIYNFDLRMFYETSNLVKDLELQSRKNLTQEQDPAIAAVREETLQAVESQIITTDTPSTSIQNPSFLRRPTTATSETGGLSALPGAPPGASSFNQGTFPAGLNPAKLPPTLALPGNPTRTITPSEIINGPGVATGQPDNSPGRSGLAPGQFVRNPGRGNGGPPGRSGSAPGQSVTNPGRGNGGPPGRSGSAPGQSVTNPGRGNGGPPGRSISDP